METSSDVAQECMLTVLRRRHDGLVTLVSIVPRDMSSLLLRASDIGPGHLASPSPQSYRLSSKFLLNTDLPGSGLSSKFRNASVPPRCPFRYHLRIPRLKTAALLGTSILAR